MERFVSVSVAILVLITILILGGVFSDPITRYIRRRIPHFTYEGETLMLWGLLIATAFVLGLMVMYLLLRL